MASVSFKNVYKKFGDVTAVNDLNIHIEDKEFLVLVGPSGCGKTTALRSLAGSILYRALGQYRHAVRGRKAQSRAQARQAAADDGHIEIHHVWMGRVCRPVLGGLIQSPAGCHVAGQRLSVTQDGPAAHLPGWWGA